jgi:hypothetical protein
MMLGNMQKYKILNPTEFDWDAKGHKFASIWILSYIQDKPVIVFGHDHKHRSISSFGGKPNSFETAIETAIRETKEESCKTIILSKSYVKKNIRMILHHIDKPGYMFIVRMDNFDLNNRSKRMKEELRTEKRKDYRENSDMVGIYLSTLFSGLNKDKMIVRDIHSKQYKIRPIIISTLFFLKDNLK